MMILYKFFCIEKSSKTSVHKLVDLLDVKLTEKKAKTVWRDWEELQKPGKWHKNMIKDWVRTTFSFEYNACYLWVVCCPGA
jgi:hypothetical protein